MIKVNVGCGKRNFGPDWWHVDGEAHDHVQSHDVFNLPFADGAVDLIYSSHLLEYFNREEGRYLLSCWHKKLKQGGELRLAVPDFEAISKLYVAKEYEVEQFLGLLYGEMRMAGQNIYHKTVYDYKSLCRVLASVGFTEIMQQENIIPSDVLKNCDDDHSKARLPHMTDKGIIMSLNVICYKQ